MGRIAIQRKIPNGCHIKLQVKMSKYLVCICMSHICAPNMKCLCLNLWLGEVCTDDTNDDANTDTNDDDARWTKHNHTRVVQ